MTPPAHPRFRGAPPPKPNGGSVLLVALLLASIIGISLVSYVKVCTTSLNLAQRSYLANAAGALAEAGLEEAVSSFNQMGAGTAAVTVWSNLNGWTTSTSTVACVTISAAGTGYTGAPTVSLAGGGGSGATATASVTGGVVTDVRVTNAGSGYTSAPTVSFSGGGGSGAAATATNLSATRTLPTFNLDQNAIGVVKVFVAGYDGSCSTPLIVAKATVTPIGSSTPIVKIISTSLKSGQFWTRGIVAQNGITWNGHPSADSWISNPTNAANGPWAAYPGTGARANTTVADFSGSVGLGAQGVVNGNLELGSGATYGGSGTVTGATSHSLSYSFAMPAYPTTGSLDHYTNLGNTIPATLPGASDVPNTADGRYYYFATGAALGTTVAAGRNVTIIGSGGSNISGTITVPSTGSLIIYTDGSVSGTLTNNAWAGALQIFTSTTTGIAINGNQNIKCCLFAPNAAFTGNGGGNSGAFYGALVAKTITSNGHMDFHYDESLAKLSGPKAWKLTLWRHYQSAAERSLFSTQLNF